MYAGTVSGELDPRVADVPERVYVPNEESDDVTVIDPATFEVIDRFPVGDAPEHVNPDWGLESLWVSNMNGGFLTEIDPMTSKPIGEVDLPIYPYALYYTLDGEKVMVITNYIAQEAVGDNGVHFYDPDTWELLAYVNVPWPGADDADLTADGRYLAISAEYSGYLVFIDTEEMTLAGQVEIGSLPRDVRLSPDGSVFYVTNEGLGGIQVVDAEAWELLEFIPTGEGTHGIDFSRDTTLMYVANRAAGTISVIDVIHERRRGHLAGGGLAGRDGAESRRQPAVGLEPVSRVGLGRRHGDRRGDHDHRDRGESTRVDVLAAAGLDGHRPERQHALSGDRMPVLHR